MEARITAERDARMEADGGKLLYGMDKELAEKAAAKAATPFSSVVLSAPNGARMVRGLRASAAASGCGPA